MPAVRSNSSHVLRDFTHATSAKAGKKTARLVFNAFTAALDPQERGAHLAGMARAFTEDVPVGTWTLVKFSGALPQPRVRELLNRVRALQAAVKTAREEANMHQVTDQQVGEAVLGYLFS